MDQEKFGQFIKKIRQEHNLTQKEIAEKYHVTYQAVSKWENGKNIPDLLIIKEICRDFNVSIDEILGNEKKKDKKKFGLLIGCLVIVIICGIVFVSTKNRDEDFRFNTLSSSCKDFTLSGSIAYNRQKSYIYITNIDYCGEEDNTKYDVIECSLYEIHNGKSVEISNYKYKELKKVTLKEFLKDVTFMVDNYNQVCDKYSNDSLYLVIRARKDNKQVNYDIKLAVEDDC